MAWSPAHAMCTQLAYSYFTTTEKAKNFPACHDRRFRSAFIHLNTCSGFQWIHPAQEAKTRNAFAAAQRKGLKGHSKSTADTFHRLLDIPSQTKEWEEKFEGTQSLQFMSGKKEPLNPQPMMAGKPSFASSFPIRGMKLLWRMNGMAEITDQPFPSSLK